MVTFEYGVDIMEYPNVAARMMSEKLKITVEAAFVCLAFYGWNEEALIADIEAIGRGEVFKKSGYMVKVQDYSGGFATCDLCKETTKINSNYGCGHLYCQGCITDYCRQKVRNGDSTVRCPTATCTMVLPKQVVSDELHDSGLAFDLDMLTLQSFVSASPDMTWCSAMYCSCLITHRNWPKENTIVCQLCKTKMKIQENGKAIAYDDTTFTDEYFQSRGIKRPWWLMR